MSSLLETLSAAHDIQKYKAAIAELAQGLGFTRQWLNESAARWLRILQEVNKSDGLWNLTG